MTAATAFSRTTADPSQCWLTAGHDDARPERALKGRQSGLRNGSVASLAPFGVSFIDPRPARHVERCIDTCPLQQRCQRNPHSAR